MKKIKKVLFVSTFAFALTSIGLGVASATSVAVNTQVPQQQGYSNIIGANKSQTSSYGEVKLTSMESASAVTFYAKPVADLYYPNAGAVVNTLNTKYKVYYNNNHDVAYDAGVAVQARLRNHSWSLTRGHVVGTFDYK